MQEKSPPSMQDIAERARVSRATVCLALRNDPRLLAATRERVQTIARELGYRPDPVMSLHMARVQARKPVKEVGTLGFITAFPTRLGWRNTSGLYLDYFEGASERAHQLGYRIEEIWSKEAGMTGKRLTSILHARNIRGLLIAPLPASHGHLSLDWSQFAAAT